MAIFGDLNLLWWDGLIVLAICLFDEYIVKGLIFKKSDKYKAVYTYLPVVLGALVYLGIALATKTSAFGGLMRGVGIGLASMGSYDAILKVFKEKGASTVKEIGEAVKEEVEK